MNADADCPNCGLGNYYPTDPTSPYYPFCDQRCHAAYEERRQLRRIRWDLFCWTMRAHLDRARAAAAGLRSRW